MSRHLIVPFYEREVWDREQQRKRIKELVHGDKNFLKRQAKIAELTDPETRELMEKSDENIL